MQKGFDLTHVIPLLEYVDYGSTDINKLRDMQRCRFRCASATTAARLVLQYLSCGVMGAPF